MNKPFVPADILIPKGDLNTFSVVACDQYTSEPLYWDNVKSIVAENPSSLNMIFPEIFLKDGKFDQHINDINTTMEKYITENLFDKYPNAYVYVERTLKNGAVRKGIIGACDLCEYDYNKGSQTKIRATEGTVLDRIPPRVRVRENAPLELPHIMLLIDDINKSIIEPLATKKNNFVKIYDFNLMQDSGSIKGYLLPPSEIDSINNKLLELDNQENFNKKYNVHDKDILVYAVGDGNHSLATAKKCFTNLQEKIGDAALSSKARYALVELGNLHDDSLEFEAIHRVMFDVNPLDMMQKLSEFYILSEVETKNSQKIEVIIDTDTKTLYIANPKLNLAVGSLQAFIDDYLSKNNGEVDYIHGDDVVRNLCKQHKTIGFILPCMEKNDLFKTVILDGALPRKTFSMGEACDKRFYLECREIK